MSTAIVKCPHCGKSNRVPAAADGRPRCGNCHRELPWIVRAVPTLMVIVGGKIVARQAGAAPADVLRPWLEKALAGR